MGGCAGDQGESRSKLSAIEMLSDKLREGSGLGVNHFLLEPGVRGGGPG